MKNYKLFEKKRFIFSNGFRISDMVPDMITQETLDEWKKIYDIDDLAHAIYVVDNKLEKKYGNVFNLRVSSKGMKNKIYFHDNKKKSGFIIKEGEKEIDGEKIKLFVLHKNSNEKNRARQNHGFKYEFNIIKYNKLSKKKEVKEKTYQEYTSKWDAYGSINQDYFEERLNQEKKIEYYDGKKYNNISWETLDNKFKQNYYWNIKCMGKKNNIEMSDFRRVAGINTKTFEKLTPHSREFMFCVARYDESSQDEYLIIMSLDQWNKYLPKHDTEKFVNMFSDLQTHSLKNREKTNETEIEWKKYKSKYKQITDKSTIKLRFKRDTKGQLRIQCAIRSSDFNKKILTENKHIKIS